MICTVRSAPVIHYLGRVIPCQAPGWAAWHRAGSWSCDGSEGQAPLGTSGREGEQEYEEEEKSSLVPPGAAPMWAWGKQKRKTTPLQVGWGLGAPGRWQSSGRAWGRSEQPSRSQFGWQSQHCRAQPQRHMQPGPLPGFILAALSVTSPGGLQGKKHLFCADNAYLHWKSIPDKSFPRDPA